jgi:hypothetical protein
VQTVAKYDQVLGAGGGGEVFECTKTISMI